MKTKLFIIALAATMLAGCTQGPKTIKTLTLTEDEETLSQAQNYSFALNLLQQVHYDMEENILISPFSVGVASAMIANGAHGNTLAEIMRTLGAEDYSVDDLNNYYSKLISTLPYLDATTDMRIANGIWFDDQVKPNENFVEANKRSYQATVDIIDLGSSASAKIINNWASLHTNKLIKKVVDESMFSDDLKAILANALYFKGIWQNEFKKSDTSKGDFTCLDGNTIQVDMMHQTLECMVTPIRVTNASERDTQMEPSLNCRMLRLPFKGGAYNMDILLPYYFWNSDFLPFGVQTLSLTEKTLEKCKTYVKLPKFTLTYHRELSNDMRELGMRDVFSPQTADLSCISDQALFIGRLLHDTYIEVNEKGAEAAAVTTAMGYNTATLDSEMQSFIVDRPFYFFIREAKYGTILFAGRVGNPGK
jgi:serpin B